MSTYVEFLQSDMIELCASGSTCTFRIHQKLLQNKCKAASGAFRHKFPEAESKRYTFSETADLTISQFVEWAYKGDYDEPDLSAVDKCQWKQHKHKQEAPGAEMTIATSEDNADAEGVLMHHTLLCHLRVYIFADTYLVSGLRTLAFEKLTAGLIEMGLPGTLNEQLAVVDCLKEAFTRVPARDDLLDWLARYAAWSLDRLRQVTQFHDVLKDRPALGSCMMETLNPATEAPWKAKARKLRVPAYSARDDSMYAEDEPVYE
ncbi:uncharacterized protein N7473_011137 [Penicillium subrubescens]|uniref:BTB domain-containing protein n=1 Tax=Penicillium subrubescens TaxID=1316194 RepID=A0A1Q5UAK6_9EURO|nr:uncharacterized protein N7473_011137 [Penicillium subrubescens]KAJ5882703.1 hypothetical protein N7473_011137 [Penicillium subrubescens]OKP09500.1 hypothetical protein PENSUB_5149 [Penicillium subrubescens]